MELPYPGPRMLAAHISSNWMRSQLYCNLNLHMRQLCPTAPTKRNSQVLGTRDCAETLILCMSACTM